MITLGLSSQGFGRAEGKPQYVDQQGEPCLPQPAVKSRKWVEVEEARGAQL